MPNSLIRALRLFVAVACLHAAAAVAGPKEEVDAAEDARYKVMAEGDRVGLAAALADEFQYHQPSGIVTGKAAYIEQVTGGGVKIFGAERYDVAIHVYGDTATAMGSTKVDVEIKGKRMLFDLRYLNVWVHRDGRWQLAARQSAFKQPPK